jgi:DNA-binding NarL/FixJ family response regulator
MSRVLLVDDHPIVRQGLRHLIGNEPDLEVCGEAASVREAREAIRQVAPDVVVSDISLRDGDGIELVTELRAHYPALPVLVLSMHDEAIYAERMLAAGASGYIMKQAASEQFIVALRQVLAGGRWVSEAVSARILHKLAAGGTPSPTTPVDQLSNRELQVLRMIGRGLSSRQVADTLHLSVKTVEAHRQRIKQKLELTTGAQLVRYAAAWVAGRDAAAGRAADD